MELRLPFAAGIATQEYLTAEEGAIRAHEEECTHWYVDMSLPSDHAHEWPRPRRRSLAKLADGLGVRPIVHGNFRAPLSTEIPEVAVGILAYLETELQLASDLGAPLIVHGGALVDPRPTESGRWSALQRFLRILEQALVVAEGLGVEVWVENLSHYPRFRPFTYVFTRYADFVTVRDYLPETAFIFDVGHANVNQTLPLNLFQEMREAIKAISVSDNDGRADSHLGLGRGHVPIKELTGVIGETGWSGLVAFETRGAPVREGVEVLAAYLPG
ncbi:sugar phosphate isomerase/epimerase family protein [Streptomyces sp.]|uniref:sugar phosphate isomerase/epimerase family protein n=1 Tax=Streptomyces sp. TaxID=1931 RepID=UPI002D780B02|nr:sugar phosphate isomerase/epimerase family protein [Streptomyces sp.]HET6355443.1 sugar phosphate isomerase/epimerase family protein [Streptomyces sp.]